MMLGQLFQMFFPLFQNLNFWPKAFWTIFARDCNVEDMQYNFQDVLGIVLSTKGIIDLFLIIHDTCPT